MKETSVDYSKVPFPQEMIKELARFVLYPEKEIDSIQRYRKNIEMLSMLSYFVGMSKGLHNDLWDGVGSDDGFNDVEQAKHFLKEIIQSSTELSDKGETNLSNMLFLFGVAVVHNDNMKSGKYRE